MRALVQRVSRAEVRVDGRVAGSIGPGLLVLIGVTHGDGPGTVEWMARKVAGLRVFADEAGRMSKDVRAIGGGVLLVPQFTLYGDGRRGLRPDFSAAAPADVAASSIDAVAAALDTAGIPVARGVFGAHMEVELVNDGPVTLWLESPATEAGP